MSAVESAVRSAVVRIGALRDGYDGEDGGPRGEFWGSGFFVAPGWVLTSAHVVAKGRGAVWRGEPVIGVTTERGDTLAGELACALPRPSAEESAAPWEEPDLAFVRVPETSGVPQPGGLWLSDRSALGSPHVEMYGFSPLLRGGSAVDFVQVSGRASAGAGGPMMLEDAYLPAGCSGGPVVDRERGSVIGVNKGRVRESPAARATPVTALRRFSEAGAHEREVLQEVLRAHDRHHLRRFLGFDWSWPREQYDLEKRRDPGAYVSGFHAHDRAELFGRFAELPAPASSGEVLELVREALHGVLREAHRLHVHAPRNWRDGVGLLYDLHDGRPAGGESSRDRERAAVVLYAAMVCRAVAVRGRAAVPRPRTPEEERTAGGPADPVGELETWVRGAAVNLPNGIIRERVGDVLAGTDAPAQGAAYADVLVEIDPDLYGTHPWRIKLVQEDGQVTPVRQSETGVPRHELERDIRAALTHALDKGDIGEHLAAVDFMLPRALFDEPVEMWRAQEAAPGEPFSPHTLPLGYRRTVALRDRDRWMGGHISEWHKRWGAIRQGRMEAVPLVPDTAEEGHGQGPRESGEAAYTRLGLGAPHAVAVHCARTGSGGAAVAMSVAMGAGYPVALWRRCDEQHADCAQFHEGAAELLRSARPVAGPDGLRAKVRELRNRNAGAQAAGSATAWAGQLVLLYDPPQGLRRADGPLREPVQRS
ncbi:trypsin-like peptidase [Streptomyces sp. Amel2xB2]|uniref:VMAP-C domain-containing protein n=1 Tax=Streptomyces sp. Amel2xB2 TaxID=1305829 RepID=UPI000DBABCDE|nr:trypsin-like peptidase domain-containing protein [Streptomyces sp. Amel2xB2]RAJ71386.1 trypsin-like peptidase [Streptomyces sp. Amel2xB2]